MNKPFNEEELSKLTLTERARLKHLPDYLSIQEIAELYYPKPESLAEQKDHFKRNASRKSREARVKTLVDACKNKKLQYEVINIPSQTRAAPAEPLGSKEWLREFGSVQTEKEPDIYNYCASRYTIHKANFKRYLQSIDDQWPVVGLLANWWTEPQTEAVGDHAETEAKQKTLTKLEKQQAAILDAIKTKEFNPMEIPDGERGTIKLICESDNPELFKAESAFDRAWKQGIKILWKMEHYESYAHRGNN